MPSEGWAAWRGEGPEGTTTFLVGCYTDGASNGAGAAGIHLCRLDADSGALHGLGGTDAVADPSYLAVGARRDVVYAVQETSDTPSVHALRISADGAIARSSSQAVPDASPCHLSVHPSGRLLAVAAYGNGTVATYPLDAEGDIGAASCVVRHRGRGAHPDRQERPHAHAAVFTPDGTELFVPDLGIDRVERYRIAPDGGLEPLASIRLGPGSGPRHLVFAQDARVAYVVNELTSSIAVAAREGECWSVVDSVPCVPAAARDGNTSAAIRSDPSSRFLYVSNRGHDSVAVFDVDRESARLTLVEHVSTAGATPRDLGIDPSGRLLVVANQDADALVSFWIDGATGRLDPTGHALRLSTPACVLMP
jgi:6-phosphogluconolactonase